MIDQWIRESLESQAAVRQNSRAAWERLRADLVATGVTQPRGRLGFKFRRALEAGLTVAVLSLVILLALGRSPTTLASATGKHPERVAFIREGHLWVQELPGGEARRLWEGGLSHPRWSPSGQWLMAKKGDLFRIIPVPPAQGAPSGNPASRLLEGFEAVWSPRGDLIAYADRSGNLVVTDPTGGQERRLVEAASFGQVGRPFWSPDGAWLTFQSEGPPGEPGPRQTSIWKVRADGGKPVPVLKLAGDEAACLKLADWSPGGKSILYWPIPLCSSSLLADGVPLMAVPAQGGSPQELTAVMLAYDDFLVTRPTANQIAVAAGAGRSTWHAKRIEVIDLTTGSRRAVSPVEMAAIAPDWSPDGKRIAFSAMPDIGAGVGGGQEARRGLMERRIWSTAVADAALEPQPTGATQRTQLAQLAKPAQGTQLAQPARITQLTHDPAYRDEAPHWTCSGLLFARLNEAGQASLWLLEPALTGAPGGTPRQLTAVDLPQTAEREQPEAWFGYYGWLNWSEVFDLFRP